MWSLTDHFIKRDDKIAGSIAVIIIGLLGINTADAVSFFYALCHVCFVIIITACLVQQLSPAEQTASSL